MHVIGTWRKGQHLKPIILQEQHSVACPLGSLGKPTVFEESEIDVLFSFLSSNLFFSGFIFYFPWDVVFLRRKLLVHKRDSAHVRIVHTFTLDIALIRGRIYNVNSSELSCSNRLLRIQCIEFMCTFVLNPLHLKRKRKAYTRMLTG